MKRNDTLLAIYFLDIKFAPRERICSKKYNSPTEDEALFPDLKNRHPNTRMTF